MSGRSLVLVAAAAVFALAAWILSVCASIVGWHLVLGVGALFAPVYWLAHGDIERWGWLIGLPKRDPSPDDPGS